MKTQQARNKQRPLQRPFLKWAGNKFRISHHVLKRLPEGKRLIEPFVGSAAIFLNSDYEDYLLCDNNPDLIELYQLLRGQSKRFIETCAELFNDANNQAERYYQLREEFNHCSTRKRRAALFVYLNRHGYNGLCRYNKKGGYNVPFGRYLKPYFPYKEMQAFAHKAQQAEFRLQSYEKTMQEAETGDVIYCDPPYAPLSASANFTHYSSSGFDLTQQELLAHTARITAQRNIPVLISNHNTPYTRRIYQDSQITKLSVHRFISCNGQQRNKASELLALF